MGNFRSSLRAYLENYFEKGLGNLTPIERSRGLALYYIKEVFNPLNYNILGDIDEREIIQEYYTDGKDDCGLDVGINIDNHNYLFQFKYHSENDKKVDHNEFSNFKKVLERLHPVVGKEKKKSQQIKDFIDKIDWENDQFSLSYICLTNPNEPSEFENNSGLGVHKNGELNSIYEDANLSLITESELNAELKSVKKLGDPLPDVEINCRKVKNSEEPPWLKYENEEEFKSYMLMINANQVFEIYKNKSGDNLFSMNVRDFVGNRGTINKGIEASYEKDCDNFFFYNNGISAVAKEIIEDKKKNSLICKNFSVVNGAQTFTTIAKTYKKLSKDQKNSKKFKECPIMLRVTEIRSLYSTGKRIANKITEYNNRQNVVKSSDFRTNDLIHNTISNAFSKHNFNNKRYYYKIKRGGDKKPNHKKLFIDVEMTYFCKIVYTFLFGPIEFYGGSSHLFNEDPTINTETNLSRGGYFRLFGDYHKKEIKTNLGENELKYYLSIFFFTEHVKVLFKEIYKKKIDDEQKAIDNDQPNYTKKVLNFFHITFIVSSLLKSISKKKNLKIEEFMSKYFSKPSWTKEDNLVDFTKRLVNKSIDHMIWEYKTAETNDKENFVHRNWYRQQKTKKLLEDAPIKFNSDLDDMLHMI